MRRRHTPEEIKRYDFRKWIVLLALAALLILLFILRSLQGIEQEPEIAVEVTPVSTYSAQARVTSPVLLAPAPGAQLTAGEVELTGVSDPGALIRILLNGAMLGETEADTDGTWRYTATLSDAGPQELVLETTAADNSTIVSAPVSLSVAMPAIEVVPPSLDLAILDSQLEPGAISLRGTGEPGTDLDVLVDNEAIGTVRVDDDERRRAGI